ncbi:hypothetical protein LTR97_007012 [Elasticomyces elasticus]|uniref:Uncharacterized protein n=1 Tax=Elasticomyces elasticus TaxID=574655 RepID=A0AAN7W1M1_9PEZI|nr:hypothetical protein LTR97_007012 [Elasticomyces elasticus]KAK5714945.1 hypothetical protein LTR15_010361 [Elasticomyces elasticus]
MASTNPSDLFSVKGMVVVITGGATGIGLMMTQAFATGGAAKIYVVGRRKEKLDEAVKIAPEIIVPLVGDVTSKESLWQLAEQIEKETGYINLLIPNSGTLGPPIGAKTTDVSVAEYRKKCFAQNVEDWNTTFATNSTAVAFTTFAFLELLDAGNKKGNCPGRKSQVLVTTSIAGYSRLSSAIGAYPPSKAAATHLIKCLAGALVPYQIRVNGIAPGLFPSDLANALIKSFGAGEEADSTIEGNVPRDIVPAERTGKADDMAGTVLYMASAAGAYLNGNITVLDGGRVSQLPSTY